MGEAPRSLYHEAISEDHEGCSTQNMVAVLGRQVGRWLGRGQGVQASYPRGPSGGLTRIEASRCGGGPLYFGVERV